MTRRERFVGLPIACPARYGGRRSLGRLAALWLGGHLASGSASADAEPRFGAHVDAAYTSNLFKEQERRLSQFETRRDVGERYHGMQGPEDVVTTPGLEIGVGWKQHKRETELTLGAEYAVHARNPIANHLLLELEAARDLTKRDTLSLELTLTPSRFKKNYVYADVDRTQLFSRADYLEWGGALGYARRWAKRWRTGIQIGFGQKRFDDPFANRDENGYAGALQLRFDPWKRLALELGVAVGATLTPDGREFGVRVDRSRIDTEPSFGATLDLPQRFEVEAGVAYRVRTYTTGERADGAHFDRVDRRWTVEGSVSKGFGDAFALVLGTSFADSNADRLDPAQDPNEYGYQEFRVELGCGYRLE